MFQVYRKVIQLYYILFQFLFPYRLLKYVFSNINFKSKTKYLVKDVPTGDKSESKADLRIVVIKGMVSFEGVRMLPAKSLQSCLTLCDPIGCNPLGSSVHRIFQARILEWVAMPSSRGSSPPTN